MDSPRLDLAEQHDGGLDAQPLRVVITGRSAGSASALADCLGTDPTRSWLLVSSETSGLTPDTMAPNVEILTYESSSGLEGALNRLGERGIVHLLVEAGPTLLTSLVDARLVDELVVYHGGGVLGPEAPPVYLTNARHESSSMEKVFTVRETGIAGPDAVTVWRPSTLTAA